jgi:hypothetical protein
LSSVVVLAARKLDDLLEAEFATGFWVREAGTFQTMECNLAVRMTQEGGKPMDFVSATQIYLPWGPLSEDDCIARAVREVMAKIRKWREEHSAVESEQHEEPKQQSEERRPDPATGAVESQAAVARKSKRTKKAKQEPAVETW